MKLYRNVITVLGFSLVTYIFILNLACTCYTSGDRFELCFYSGNLVLPAAAAVILASVVAVNAGRLTVLTRIADHFIIAKTILLSLTAAVAIILVFSCGLGSGVDQLYVQRAVDELRRGSIDSFQPTGYMDIYPNQYGFALLCYLGSFVAGTYNYLVIRLVNVAFLILLYNELSLIGRRIGLGKRGELIILLTGMVYLPVTLYVLFVYGNLAGFALSVLAFRLMMDYFADSRIFKAVLSVAAVLGACLIKSNYMIFGVALIIYCFFKALSVKKYMRIILVPAVIAAIWLSSFVPLMVMRGITGLPLKGGVSYMSYIAMGVMDNDANYAGGFNGFNEDSYKTVGGDKDQQTEIAVDVYKQIVDGMSQDIPYTLNFFTRKQLHQWADPLYKSYWAAQSVPQYDTAGWFYRFIRPDAEYPASVVMGLIHIVMWAGVVAALWFGHKKGISDEALLLPLAFIGGFIFHTFWEAKSQYVFPFAIVLVPVSVLGWRYIRDAWKNRDRRSLKEKIDALNKTRISWNYSFTLVAASLVLIFPEILGLATLREQFAQDRALYHEYLSTGYRQSWNPLDDGIYELSSGGLKYEVETVNKGDKTYLKEVSGSRYLTASLVAEGVGELTWQEYKGDKSQAFKLYLTDGDGIIIVYNDEYVFEGQGEAVKVEMVPYGTLDWSEPNEGRTWNYVRKGA
ncbi:hypothetical protein SAMN02910456_01393 [Ruminococcaceae bacterium YRB3002]|nr:hypothetical protein SAMN02910456_01393 [Ruminococcaceae bacterium YRB3002]